ncbi:MAG: hemerythrin domain-containing protein [Bacteroidetes bacterium]|nr:hemerythrin domain-containing protein [Bacteroidota bacterium]
MHTTRYNVFGQIHKALRTLMFDSVLQLQRADLSDPENTRPAITRIELLLGMMDGHAHHEDHFILHAAEKHAPALIQEFENEHVTDLALTGQLREKIAAYWQAEDKPNAGKEIYYALNDFIAFNLEHMNKEEQVLNLVLWEHYTDAELFGMVQNIQRSIAPAEMDIAAEWMIKGMGNAELLPWFKAVKQEAPPFVFDNLMSIAEKHLAPSRWSQVQAQLN